MNEPVAALREEAKSLLVPAVKKILEQSQPCPRSNCRGCAIRIGQLLATLDACRASFLEINGSDEGFKNKSVNEQRAESLTSIMLTQKLKEDDGTYYAHLGSKVFGAWLSCLYMGYDEGVKEIESMMAEYRSRSDIEKAYQEYKSK